MTDFLDNGKTLSGNSYSAVLITTRDRIVEKERVKLSKSVLFLQDNTPAHVSHIAMQTNRHVRFKSLEQVSYFVRLPCRSPNKK